ncbi:uncharacterized protein LOC123921177 [Trifolium pratense]|uniref:uncharacterized protein LOC123921177 n=1 Tax=Trifolium pratense TaxID=57577 RepID=UPI001E697FF1|nr:uncharacterized protein LOC123921177 [Trifolium pratense]
MASEKQQQQDDDKRTIPLKILVDKQRNKVIFVESTKEFVDTLFSFLSLPLGTIVRLLSTKNNNNDKQSSDSFPFLDSIQNLYQSVQNLNSDHIWNNPVCKQMLLHPKNPCESLCMKLFLNIDDTEPSNKIFVCDSCKKFTTFQNLNCTCGKPTRQPQNLDSEGDQESSTSVESGVFVRDDGLMFMVFDDLKIVPSSLVTSMQLLIELGYPDLTQLEEIRRNIGKQEILNLLKYTLTSHEPLTNTLLASSSKNKDNPPNQSASTFKASPCTSTTSKMDIKVVQSKSKEKIIIAEANGDFVNFIFSFLTMPLGSIVNLFDGNSLTGCVGNLYKSVEKLDSSLCTDSHSVLLNPGIAPQFGCPNQPLNIPHVEDPTYYYGTERLSLNDGFFYIIKEKIEGGVISKTEGSIYDAKLLTALDPKSPNRLKEGVVGFVKRATLFSVGDDLKVKPLSANSCFSYLKELRLSLDDIEVKVISIGEAEALSLLAASLTSKFTLTDVLGDQLNVPNQESTSLKVPKQEPT